MATNTGTRTYDTSTHIPSTRAKDTGGRRTGAVPSVRLPVSIARVLQIRANKGRWGNQSTRHTVKWCAELSVVSDGIVTS